jgi:hypothetical protein
MNKARLIDTAVIAVSAAVMLGLPLSVDAERLPCYIESSLIIQRCEENLHGYSGFSSVSTSIAKDLGSNPDG